jgi:polyhydroxybutyrate depolymerase
VYLVGFSNGGFLAHRLACEHAGKVAAIVSIGGGAPEVCEPKAPVSVLAVHGVDDKIVPFAGDRLGAGLPQHDRIPSAREALLPWARADHCKAGATWSCPANAVELWALPGGHWPTTGPNFGERVWQWLKKQHR